MNDAPKTNRELELQFERLKKTTTLRQLGAALGMTFGRLTAATRDLDAILDETLAELEEQFNGAEGFRRHISAKRAASDAEM